MPRMATRKVSTVTREIPGGSTSRRGVLAGAATVVGAVSIAGCPDGTEQSGRSRERADERIDGTWRQPGGDGANTRSIDGESVTSEPDVAWSERFPIVNGEPTVADSLLYLHGSERYLAVEAATGAVYRSHDAAVSSLDGLSVADGWTYAQSFDGEDGAIAKLDPVTLDRQWTATPRGDGLYGTTIADGRVFANTATDDEAYLQALDPDDGTEHWFFEALDSIQSVAATSSVVVAVSNGTVFGIDPDTGERLWHSTIESGSDGRVALLADTAIAAVGGNLHAIGIDGTTRWTETVGPDVSIHSLAVRDGAVYAALTDAVLALDAADGAEHWRHSLGRRDDTGTVTASEGRVYVTSGSELVALSTNGGDERWRAAFDGTVHAPPAVLPDAILVFTLHSGTDGNAPVRGHALQA